MNKAIRLTGTSLLLLALSAFGCARSAPQDAPSPASAQADAGATARSVDGDAGQRQGANANLPTELIGVWSRDDAGGRAQCDRYRALPADAGGSDEGSISLIGSLVITPTMIHEYSEYGEGNFNAVKAIESLRDGSSWRVKVQVGIDTIPVDEDRSEMDPYRLELQQGKLTWAPEASHDERASTYFKCGEIRRDIYRTE